MAQNKGIAIDWYLEWLVRARSHHTCLSGYTVSHAPVSGTRLDSQYEHIRTGAQTSL